MEIFVMRYRPEIDGLRAIAVVPVILFHAGLSGITGGFVGVDVFFVISGYLITNILVERLTTKTFSIIDFYERRARRILPPLFLIIFASIPFALFLMLPRELDEFAQSVIAAATFSSNFFFWHTSGYFDIGAELKPLLHLWSLAVEEQFYLVFPILLAISWQFGRRVTITMLITLGLISLAACQIGSTHAPGANFYFPLTRAWELLAGSLCAFAPAIRDKATCDAFGAIGLALLIASILFLNSSLPYPSFYTLLPVLGSSLVILFCTGDTFATKVLRLTSLVWIGRISYSAYLWHQPIFSFARASSYGPFSYEKVLVLTAMTFFLAWLTWSLVEQPFRTKRAFLSSRAALFSFCSLSAMVLAAFGLWCHDERGLPQRENVRLFAELDNRQEVVPYQKCDRAIPIDAELDLCRFIPTEQANSIIIGDSHADDKLFGLHSADHDRRWMLAANSSCPPVLNVDVVGDVKDCSAKMSAIVRYVDANPDIKYVALAFFSGYFLKTAYAEDHKRNHAGPDRIEITSSIYGQSGRAEMFFLGLKDMIRALQNAGKQVVVLMDQPELPFLPSDCVKGKPDCFVPVSEFLKRQSVYRAAIMRIEAEDPNVRVFDPINMFCSEGTCNFNSPKGLLYRDSHHLSSYGSLVYANSFLNWEKASAKVTTR